MDYSKHLTSSVTTPQTSAIPGREADMTANRSGGVTFVVDKWTALHRFLILGSEGGSYYATEKALTLESVKSLQECLVEDGLRVVREIVEISDSGRAVKNDPAIFALSLCLRYTCDPAGYRNGTDASVAIRQAARDAVPKVCRTATHMFTLAQALKPFGGWSRVVRGAFAGWYNSKTDSSLAYQLIKYQQRGGWAHRDVLLRARVKPTSEVHKTLYHWVTQGWDTVGDEPHPEEALRQVWAFERAQLATTSKEIVGLITDYNLPRECIPTQYLNSPDVWVALLQKMQLTAMIRNLGKMSSLGLLTNSSAETKKICATLNDEVQLKRARIHPMMVLNAQRIYAKGHGLKGNLTWQPCPKITDALDDAFYKAFDYVEPTGKRICLGLDISGSMFGASCAGMQGLTAGEATAAIAMTIMRTEENWETMAFATEFQALNISPKQRLDDVIKSMRRVRMGRTDCSVPFTWAKDKQREFDAFVVMTDNETYAGRIHPSQALKKYREASGISARSAVLAFSSNKFTIADPLDPGMMDMAGLDASIPAILSNFIAGKL